MPLMMPPKMRPIIVTALALAGAAGLSACRSTGDLVADQGVGITAVRSACPAVGLADYTGDITLFRQPGNTQAGNIDLVASMTEVRGQCDDKLDPVRQDVSFKIIARRNDARDERDVELHYFVTVVRGTNVVIAKQVASVKLHFAAGQSRAEAMGKGVGLVDRKEATLDRKVQERITKVRRAGEADAAIDPLTDPEVRGDVTRDRKSVV